jgi:hypothetical protein
MALVVMLGLGVLLVLPKLVSDPVDGQADTPTVPASAQQPPARTADTAGSQAAAAEALQDLLHARARLELANAASWGEPEWSRAVEGANRGNDLFTQRQFAMAADAFSGSLRL